MAPSVTVAGDGIAGVRYFARLTDETVPTSRLNDPEHLATDTLVAFLHRTISWSIARRIPLIRMEMPYEEPSFLRYYEATFGIVPTFGAERLSFSFDAELLSAPLFRTDEDLERWIAESPENFFSTRDFGSSTTDQVRRLLREEGTSMTLIREDVLRDAAINSLVAGKESVEDLSTRLGFSESSAFRRAFRRWTGMPPGSYREGLVEETGPPITAVQGMDGIRQTRTDRPTAGSGRPETPAAPGV